MTNNKILIVCDRGILDNKSYCDGSKTFDNILKYKLKDGSIKVDATVEGAEEKTYSGGVV